jgi:hypothetical protein
MKYEEKNESIEVPKGSGIDGFLLAIRQILQLPRVQSVIIDARGKVSYKYFLREGEEALGLVLNFDELMPYAIVRNGEVEEVLPMSGNAAVVIGQLFERAASDHVYPVAWVAGANSTFWRWFDAALEGRGVAGTHRDELFGLPFLRDRMVDDRVLLLCCAFGRRAALAETQRSYKILMPGGDQ